MISNSCCGGVFVLVVQAAALRPNKVKKLIEIVYNFLIEPIEMSSFVVLEFGVSQSATCRLCFTRTPLKRPPTNADERAAGSVLDICWSAFAFVQRLKEAGLKLSHFQLLDRR